MLVEGVRYGSTGMSTSPNTILNTHMNLKLWFVSNLCLGKWYNVLWYDKKVSEYDQEIPQSHTADQATAP